MSTDMQTAAAFASTSQPPHRRLRKDSAFLYVLSAVLGAGALATANSAHALSASLIVVTGLLCAFAVQFRNPFQMMWMCGHVTFCIMPVIVISLSGNPFSFVTAALCTLFSVLVLVASHRLTFSIGRVPSVRLSLLTFVISASACVGVLVVTQGQSFLYLTPTLVVAYAVYAGAASKKGSVIGFLMFLLYVYVYVAFFWSEFGRLVIAGVVLVPTLVLCYRLQLNAMKLPLLAGMGVGGLAGSLLRIEGASLSNIAASALQDSAVGPILTAQSIMDRVAPYADLRVREWLDQLVLFFVGVFPRAWWPEKPFGFGYQYVVDNFTQSYIDAGHSIAATFMGEHIYYLQSPLFVFGTTMALAMVFGLFTLCQKLFRLNGAGGLLVCIYLPTFYWGGWASFAQRFLFGFAIFMIIVFSVTLTRRVITLVPKTVSE